MPSDQVGRLSNAIDELVNAPSKEEKTRAVARLVAHYIVERRIDALDEAKSLFSKGQGELKKRMQPETRLGLGALIGLYTLCDEFLSKDSKEQLKQAIDICLCKPLHRNILRQLCTGPMGSTDLSRKLKKSDPSQVSHALRDLRRAGLIMHQPVAPEQASDARSRPYVATEFGRDQWERLGHAYRDAPGPAPEPSDSRSTLQQVLDLFARLLVNEEGVGISETEQEILGLYVVKRPLRLDSPDPPFIGLESVIRQLDRRRLLTIKSDEVARELASWEADAKRIQYLVNELMVEDPHGGEVQLSRDDRALLARREPEFSKSVAANEFMDRINVRWFQLRFPAQGRLRSMGPLSQLLFKRLELAELAPSL